MRLRLQVICAVSAAMPALACGRVHPPRQPEPSEPASEETNILVNAREAKEADARRRKLCETPGNCTTLDKFDKCGDKYAACVAVDGDFDERTCGCTMRQTSRSPTRMPFDR